MATQDAPVVVNYGESGRGKSTDLVYTLAGGGLFLGMPGGLRVAASVVGVDVAKQIVQVSTMEEVPGYIQAAKAAGFSGVGVDDASLLMANTFLQAQRQFAKVKGGAVKGYDFAMWTYLGNVLQNVVYSARVAGIPVVLNGHEQPAYIDANTGENYLAGPDFGWKKLVKRTPHVADIAKRVVDRPFDAPGWDTRADCDNNAKAYMKDRYDVAPRTSGPLNTAEHLREGGWVLPKPRGLEWIDEVAEHVAVGIIGGQAASAVTGPMAQHLQAQGVNPLHIRWALRDGVHRAEFRKHREASVLAGF